MKRISFVLGSAATMQLFGCVVGQPPGKGQQMQLTENTTGAQFWLYLPVDDSPHKTGNNADTADQTWPLVVTFHGMKPFDDARGQIREWQQEADRYGYIVCAPMLQSCDVFGQFPIRRIDDNLRIDERNTLAIMNAVARDYNVDRKRVFSTSWSSGGYVAHYMANRHPERFACVAVRQSNFNADILDPMLAAEHNDRKVGIFFTENDFKICKDESADAAEWYARLGYDVAYTKFANRGHERLPGPAAWFFAEQFGIEAKSPSLELARMQVREIPPIPGNGPTSAAAPPQKMADPAGVDVQAPGTHATDLSGAGAGGFDVREAGEP